MAEVKKVWKRWQVLTGKHALNSGATFKKGEKFITEANMNVFNTDPQNPKYKDLGEVSEKEALDWAVNEGTRPNTGTTNLPPTQEEVDETPTDALEAMSVNDLKALADDEGIDISSAHRKADIVEAIRTARANASDDE